MYLYQPHFKWRTASYLRNQSERQRGHRQGGGDDNEDLIRIGERPVMNTAQKPQRPNQSTATS